MKRGIGIAAMLMACVCFSFAAIAGEDPIATAQMRSLDGIKAAYVFYKNAYTGQHTYETAWKYAKAAYYYATYVIKDQPTQLTIFEEGKNAAEAATKFNISGVDGYYWFSVCIGSWAERVSQMKQLEMIDPMLKNINKAISLNPGYLNGSCYMVRGRLYQKAPGVISIGDKNKAKEDYETAMSYGKNKNRTLYTFYVELLIELGEKAKAKTMIIEGQNIPMAADDVVGENANKMKLMDLSFKAN